jgi:hypothetical protein
MMPPRTPVQMEFSVSTGLSQDAGHKCTSGVAN